MLSLFSEVAEERPLLCVVDDAQSSDQDSAPTLAFVARRLLAQERQIAELARDGLLNPEIGARLFLSPRTVEWHPRHVFAKLGIHSRRELAKVPSSSSELVPT